MYECLRGSCCRQKPIIDFNLEIDILGYRTEKSDRTEYIEGVTMTQMAEKLTGKSLEENPSKEELEVMMGESGYFGETSA